MNEKDLQTHLEMLTTDIQTAMDVQAFVVPGAMAKAEVDPARKLKDANSYIWIRFADRKTAAIDLPQKIGDINAYLEMCFLDAQTAIDKIKEVLRGCS
jgi:hypothetical protein